MKEIWWVNLKNNDPNPKDAETSSSPQAVDQRLTAVENSIGELNNAIVGMLQAIEQLAAEIGEVLMKQNKGKDIDYSSQELQENRGTRNQQPKKQKEPHLGERSRTIKIPIKKSTAGSTAR